jgi:hypothetical protein
MQTIFKSIAMTSALLLIGTSNSKAADICNERGFESVPDGQLRVENDATGQRIEFRTSADKLSGRYGSGEISALPAIAGQAARDAIYAEFARVSRPPTDGASLQIRGMQSVAAICDGVKVFDFQVPLSGLQWRTAREQSDDEMLPPIRQFLRDNGFIE